MLFSSITFIFIFLPATIALNLIVPEHGCKFILLCMGRAGLCYFDDLIDLFELFLRKRNF